MDKEERNIHKKIIEDHFELSKNNTNINYLWFIYKDGFRRGEYKPFMLLAELNLCKYFNILSEEEFKNIKEMLLSPDPDNHYMAIKIIKKFMYDRHKKYGKDMTHDDYTGIRDQYEKLVLSTDILQKKFMHERD